MQTATAINKQQIFRASILDFSTIAFIFVEICACQVCNSTNGIIEYTALDSTDNDDDF